MFEQVAKVAIRRFWLFRVPENIYWSGLLSARDSHGTWNMYICSKTDIAISACRQYEAIPLFWLVTLAGKMSPSKVCPFWFRASKKGCLRRTRNFWTTAALESQQAAEAGQSKENKNDLRGSTVQQTQVAFFPGSPNNQVIFYSC